MMGAAFEDGADYMYRINDDTKFQGPWAMQAVSALRRMDPPNVGVVGPLCDEGNQKIMTHDFTHRTHMRIFDHCLVVQHQHPLWLFHLGAVL